MTYHEAIRFCAERYETMLENRLDNDYYWGVKEGPSIQDQLQLLSFIREMKSFSCDEQFPLMKLNRWLGYIQGTLIQWGLTSVDVERNLTRPIFRPLDFPIDS